MIGLVTTDGYFISSRLNPNKIISCNPPVVLFKSNFGGSKTTLYKYLRARNLAIGWIKYK